jgi:hypothetical protein
MVVNRISCIAYPSCAKLHIDHNVIGYRLVTALSFPNDMNTQAIDDELGAVPLPFHTRRVVYIINGAHARQPRRLQLPLRSSSSAPSSTTEVGTTSERCRYSKVLQVVFVFDKYLGYWTRPPPFLGNRAYSSRSTFPHVPS